MEVVRVSAQVHWDEVPGRRAEVGPLRGTWTDLGRAGGSIATGLRRIQVNPGMRSTPVHVHDAEEEIFFVLGGQGLSWQDGKTCTVGVNDCIVHPAGAAAHTLIAGAEGLDVLAFGTRCPAPTCRLPRACVAWLGGTWVDVGSEPGPWGREVAAGELAVPAPGERFAGVVALADVAEQVRARGDTGRLSRALGKAAGARLTGLNHVVVTAGMLSCPPHVHAREEEIFVVLDGTGDLLLYECDNGCAAPPAEHLVRPGSVVVRPAGSGVAHAFRAGDGDLTLLAYGQSRGDEMVFYPRSRKVRFRGLGVTGRLELCDYWDAEPPEG
jgi:uncharacterized cupin superfamily protein